MLTKSLSSFYYSLSYLGNCIATIAIFFFSPNLGNGIATIFLSPPYNHIISFSPLLLFLTISTTLLLKFTYTLTHLNNFK